MIYPPGTGNYILDGHNAVRCDNLLEWAKSFETTDRRVALDHVGEVEVSTVFLGLDHNFFVGDPILFETMIFGGEHDQDQWRHKTWDEAEAFHKQLVLALQTGKDYPHA